ncbi:MAG: carbamoyl-phosphate synthase large subunit [Planctomycetes bacterium]|nr:carbamoyl-phosphate synthase large subunit [Planctomycetota bacterium]
MPRRDDIHTILIIGAGPIVIGQGCEFDYSGTQACKALKEEGYRVVLVNSNPATIMTDPEFADRTYIEPITPETVEKIIIAERESGHPIDALLPTLGGQTGLNCACKLWDMGILQKHDVQMIGANREVIHRAEDRKRFREIVEGLGLKQPLAKTVNTLDEAWEFLEICGLPAIIRPAFTLGGTGGGIAYNREEFEQIIRRGLDASMTNQVLIDQSVLGWKEYELEVMRDKADNVVIICSIENIDAMGVHTGDSITVAPAQTLTDKEYQRMRDAAVAIMRAVGVETGGSNVQFGVNPADGELVVVEMNPRVSRSSALASKATGFPIAKIAAKLAVGYTLDELPNDITGKTVACFEPTIDYVVTKIPRWTFEKFPEADETLTTQMKSVGEAMSIGRTFKESLQKGIRSMEVKRFGLGLDRNDKWLNARRGVEGVEWPIDETKLRRKLTVPSQGRLYYVRYAMKMGWTIEQVHDLTKYDPWFLDQVEQLVKFEDVLCQYKKLADVPADVLRQAKQFGYSDPQLANLYMGEISTDAILAVRAHRKKLGVEPVYKLVDTCAAEFEAQTPYYYSTYESPFTIVGDDAKKNASPVCYAGEVGEMRFDDEVRVTNRKKIVILGGGPNRIGQGIEFDYCCVQAAFAAQELGFEAVMVNSNPETVSTDYDTSDLLFFEPLTLEDVLNICERLNGAPLGQPGHLYGAIVQFGGQTPLNLAHGLEKAGVPIIGTSVDSIDLAEDRDRFQKLLHELNIKQPANGIARSLDQAVEIAARIGYPVLVRPSYVLGGRGMETCFTEEQLRLYMKTAVDVSELANAPVLIDDFLAEAIECDVDVVGDFGSPNPRALICGVMEHIEEAGIHSGDSACAIPPYSLPKRTIDKLVDSSRRLAEALNVRGLMNIQYAITRPSKDHPDYEIYVLEVNPRASRTVPFVSKATGVSWARVAAKVMAGQTLEDIGVGENYLPAHTSVKESVFPFSKFPGVDVILGPEMRSTGEVMGADTDFAVAFAKSQIAANSPLPTSGNVFLSVRSSDKSHVVEVAKQLLACGMHIYTTVGTHQWLSEHGVETELVKKISEGRPNALDLIKNDTIDLILNTPTRKGMNTDEGKLRAAAVRFNVPIITTTTGGAAAAQAITALRRGEWTVRALQDYYPVYQTGRTRAAQETAAR